MSEKQKEFDLKKEYSTLQKKYSLPTLENLEENFGSLDIEHEKFLLVGIRKKMGEKIDQYSQLLANIFEGDTNLVNVYESCTLNETKKAKLFLNYKKLMKYIRQSNILSLTYNEKEEAVFIKDFYNDWDEIKKVIKKQLEEFRDSWESDENLSEEIQNYLG